jgi:glutathione S-transferase
MPNPTVHGFPVSPNVRAVRVALIEKGVPHAANEIDFAHLATPAYGALNPFRKMPVLATDAGNIYETPAILRYVDEAFDGPALQPATPAARATMTRWIAIAHNYLYAAGVMQLFLHRVMLPKMGGMTDEAVVENGRAASATHLDVLESELGGGFLAGNEPSLADFYAGCMVDLIARTPEGAALVGARPRVAAWLATLRARPAFAATVPAALAA